MDPLHRSAGSVRVLHAMNIRCDDVDDRTKHIQNGRTNETKKN